MYLEQRRQLLRAKLRSDRADPGTRLKTNDPFLATSCFQKALRRGDLRHAIAAAKSLLAIDPRRFWRRLVIAVFEDFGLSELDLTADIVAAASDKRWREEVGGDESVALHIIDSLTRRARDRRVDNLYMLAVRHVRQPSSRRDFFVKNPSGILTDLVVRAERLVTACEQEVPPRMLRSVVARNCDAALSDMQQQGIVEPELLAVCSQGRRTAICLLPILLPLVKRATETVGAPTTVQTSESLEVRVFGDLPSYALDGYTRIGKQALSLLAKTDHRVAGAVSKARGSLRSEALTYLLFEVEGGFCTEELSDPIHDELQRMAIGCWTGLPAESISEAIEVVRKALPKLNDIRRDLISGANGGYRE